MSKKLEHLFLQAVLNPLVAPALAALAQEQNEAEKHMLAIRALTGASEKRIKQVAATKPYPLSDLYHYMPAGNSDILAELRED